MCSKHIPVTNGTGYKGIITATCMIVHVDKQGDGETVSL